MHLESLDVDTDTDISVCMLLIEKQTHNWQRKQVVYHLTIITGAVVVLRLL